MKEKMGGNELIQIDEIQSRIYTVRGLQVMLDVDLANFYGVETRIINQAVKRNEERFPNSFKFTLSNQEVANLKSQFVISSWGGRRTNPTAFTETGVAMLSVVLRSSTAVRISVIIMEAFVKMRHFIASNAQIFQRLESLEIRQTETDDKIEKVLTALENNQLQPKQGVFFNSQIFDAHTFVCDLIRSAEKSIVLIDNFVDDTVLTLFSKRKQGVTLKILTKNVTKQLRLDIEKFNEQFPPAEIQEFDQSHDRFLIIDDSQVYHIGASLKDLGRKWFAFSKMELSETRKLLSNI